MAEEDTFISGEKIDLSGRTKFLGEFIHGRLKEQQMDKMFQVILDSNEQMTFGQLFKLSTQICRGLIQRGMKQGDIIALEGSNSNAIHATLLGGIWAGAVPSPIGTGMKMVEMNGILRQLEPKWVFCWSESLDIVSSCLKSLNNDAKIILFDSPQSPSKDHLRLEDILVEVDLNTFAPQKVDNPDDLALALCSSGTMGIPKCVGLTHKTLLNLYLWEYVNDVDIKKPYLLTSAFSWITGVYFLFISCIYGTFRVVTTSNKPDHILKSIQDYKLHGMMIPPSVIHLVLESPELRNYDASSLKQVWTGGSPLGQFTVEKFKKEWPDKRLSQCYGLTESGGIVTRPDERPFSLSAGRVLQNTDIKIVDPNTDQSLGPNKKGEICVRSKFLFKTYIGNEEAVKYTLKNGWLHTGDIGYYSEDGRLYISSRIKELIKIHNKQISPVEIENYLSSLPGIIDAGISEVTKAEITIGIMALVVKSPHSTITAEYIIKEVEEKLGSYNQLTAGVYFVDKLPRSISGKLRRKYLKEMADALYEKNKETH